MGRLRREPVGRRRPHRDPQHHHVLRPVHRLHQRGVRQERAGHPRRATRRSQRQSDYPDQAELPGRVPDRREWPLLPDRARWLAGDPLAGVQDQPEVVRAVRRRGGHAVHVPARRRGDRGVLREERLAARRRRAVRGAAATGDDVRQGAEAGAHGLPVSHVPDWASAATAGAAAGAGATPERHRSDNSQDLLVVTTHWSECQIKAGPLYRLIQLGINLAYSKCLM